MLKVPSTLLLSAAMLCNAAPAEPSPQGKPAEKPVHAKPVAEQPAGQELPPGWVPVNRLDDHAAWSDIREIKDRVHLYLPPGVDNVRGVFACVVFHSQDPRALARHWRFALVAILGRCSGMWGCRTSGARAQR